MTVTLSSAQWTALAPWALRYALGRRTYIASDVASALGAGAPLLPDAVRDELAMRIEAAIDAEHAGDACDVDAWVRAAQQLRAGAADAPPVAFARGNHRGMMFLTAAFRGLLERGRPDEPGYARAQGELVELLAAVSDPVGIGVVYRDLAEAPRYHRDAPATAAASWDRFARDLWQLLDEESRASAESSVRSQA